MGFDVTFCIAEPVAAAVILRRVFREVCNKTEAAALHLHSSTGHTAPVTTRRGRGRHSSRHCDYSRNWGGLAPTPSTMARPVVASWFQGGVTHPCEIRSFGEFP
jgi:hypothetical protein